MAVAVKNPPEVASASVFDRLAVASLAGTAYVLGMLGIVFYLLPSLWMAEGTVGVAVRFLVQLAVLAGLIVFGIRMLGPKTMPGIRAGIFIGLVGVLLVILLTRWASLWIEHYTFDRGLLSPSTGAVVTAVVGLALLVLGIRLFLRKGSERFLMQLEEQGWFTAKAYKGLQGVRVRRGTIFGILLLVGAGIWTLLSHNTLRKGPSSWQVNVPFTGQVHVHSIGDVKADTLDTYIPEWKSLLEEDNLVADRFTLREINQSVDSSKYVKIFEPGSTDYDTGDIVPVDDLRKAEKTQKAEGGTPPKGVPPQSASGTISYRALTLLPSLQFTVPLLLMAAGLWLAWRVVNWPAFADFLIATEAEMNKVSWTTQRRLIQDTIVVLVAVVLMAFFLFSMDMVWEHVLSWKPIGVLLKPDTKPETSTNIENRPW